MVQDHVTCMFVVVELCYVFILKFISYHMFMCNWKVYSKVIGHLKGYSTVSLKMLPWRVTEKATLMGHWKGYPDGWRVTWKSILTCHWKDYYVGWWIIENITLTYHWKSYPDGWLKRLPWRVMSHWKGYPDVSLKRLLCRVPDHWKGYSNMSLKKIWWWLMYH
jgi:hypothetical protein